MKYLDEYRDPALASPLIEGIRKVSRRSWRVMEICGTHTVSIFRHGIRDVLPSAITLISGPGCPVCVTAQVDIDRCIKLARIPGVIVATFGDLMRVPGSGSSLAMEKARGADVRMVYSTFDALEAARSHPEQQVVFLGIGFETTAPTVAAAITAAASQGLSNFSVLSLHKLLPPAMEALLSAGECRIQGFICPGHVSMIIGTRAYEALAGRYNTPCVVTGFEPVDILEGLYRLIQLLEQNKPLVEIQYRRAVAPEGAPRALEMLHTVFEPTDAVWRGLGVISDSGLKVRESFSAFDAEHRFDLHIPDPGDSPGCGCGEVIRGLKTPTECPLFGSICTPQDPVGPCMVSSEGSCAAYYRYRL
jgi:hydrogenase expression/formation protein HypD